VQVGKITAGGHNIGDAGFAIGLAQCTQICKGSVAEVGATCDAGVAGVVAGGIKHCSGAFISCGRSAR